jgi:nitrite reductase (NADH) large subunit
MKILIIGNGAAAISGVKAVRQMNRDWEIELLSDEVHPFYSRVMLPDYLAGNIRRTDLYLVDWDFYRDLGIKATLGAQVEALEPKLARVITASGQRIHYDLLLIASGAGPVLPGVEGINLKGVFTLRSIDDVEAIRRYLQSTNVERAIIVGGGLVSLRTAEAFHKLGIPTTIVVSSSRLMSQTLDEASSEALLRAVRKAGHEVLLNEDVTAFYGTTHLRGAKLASGGKAAGQLALIGKGVRPRLSLVEGTSIAVDRGILVDEYLRTSIPKIYAAGDVTQSYDLIRKRRVCNGIWPSAVRQGRIAGCNMAGLSISDEGDLPMNSVHVFGCSICSLGVLAGDETYVRGSLQDNNYRKLVFSGSQLVGALFWGSLRDAGRCYWLLRTGRRPTGGTLPPVWDGMPLGRC